MLNMNGGIGMVTDGIMTAVQGIIDRFSSQEKKLLVK